MSLACGIVLAVCFLIFMDPLLNWIGASADTWEYAKTYLIICTLGGPAALLSSCFSNTIRSEGRATMAMIGQIIGNLTNMVLDAVFIMGFGWGIIGCALATLVGECVGCLWYLIYYIGKKSMLGISLKNFSAGNGIASGVLSIGIPAALASILMSASQILINARMSAYGDTAVAGIGVAMKVVIITGMLCMGFGQGVQPLLGYAVGAKNWGRFRKLMKYSVIFSLVIGGVLTVLCYVFDRQIVGMFLTAVSGICWTLVYVDLIRLGFKDRTCGMPLFAPGLNIAWEALYSIDGLFLHRAFIPAQSAANAVWALCDCAVLATWFRFGKQLIPEKAQHYFIPYTILTLAPSILGGFVENMNWYIICMGTVSFVFDIVYIIFLAKTQKPACLP